MKISVSGRETVRQAPELASVQVQIEVEDAKTDVAMRQVEALAKELRSDADGLQGKGLEQFHLTGVRTWTWRPMRDDGTPAEPRYRASCEASAKFGDFEALSAFVANWGAKADVNLHSVEWKLRPETERTLGDQVLAAAVKQSFTRAQQISDAAGGGTVRVVAVGDPSALGPGAPGGAGLRFAMAGNGGGVEFSPQDVEVSAEVVAEFEA